MDSSLRSIIRGWWRWDEAINRSVRKFQKKHPDKVETTKRFAIEAIIWSCFSVVTAPLFAYLSYWLFVITFTRMLAIIGNIFTFAMAFSAVFIPIGFARSSIVYAISQKTCNKQKIGTVALVLGIISLCLTILIVIPMTIILIAQAIK